MWDHGAGCHLGLLRNPVGLLAPTESPDRREPPPVARATALEAGHCACQVGRAARDAIAYEEAARQANRGDPS
jgi:hypothetical protein